MRLAVLNVKFCPNAGQLVLLNRQLSRVRSPRHAVIAIDHGQLTRARRSQQIIQRQMPNKSGITARMNLRSL
jgi:hypothetical protein